MPLTHFISFEKVLKYYDAQKDSERPELSQRANIILKAAQEYPLLRKGFNDLSLMQHYKDTIDLILQDTFADILSGEELKVAMVPFTNVIFKASVGFKNIMAQAGATYEAEFRKMAPHINYVMGCVFILQRYYNFQVSMDRPYFFDVPDAQGVMRHYQATYNMQFMEVFPTEQSKVLNQADVDELLEAPDDLSLWMEKIPPESFSSKGFVLANLFDVTVEQAISEIKTSLIDHTKRGSETFKVNLRQNFRSFFGIPDLEIGFDLYDPLEDTIQPAFDLSITSVLWPQKGAGLCKEVLCERSYNSIIKQKTYFSISDVAAQSDHKSAGIYACLLKQGIHSAIFAPLSKNGNLLGILEVVSSTKYALNALNASKLDLLMPYIITAVERNITEEKNLIEAVIQQECTAIHPSVRWKFEEEAKCFITKKLRGENPSFKEIVIKHVYPLYGQIDIKDSSEARNLAIQKDLTAQLSEIKKIMLLAFKKQRLPIYEDLIFMINTFIESIAKNLNTNSEREIFDFVKSKINPVWQHLKHSDALLAREINSYESHIDRATQSFYDHRKNFDDSVRKINNELAAVIDFRQLEAQDIFPHFYERYKTDGVEHNLYVGQSISKKRNFDLLYLNNLKLWQLQVMCEMEQRHHMLKHTLAVPLDVASLILVHNTTLSIRFRMDEKQFDVDGTYNARYEIIKKRIDKSFIKNTKKRLTEPGTMVIVYSHKKDELEYLGYIDFLRERGYFTEDIEVVALQELQGVTGLMAIRVGIQYGDAEKLKRPYPNMTDQTDKV